MALFYHVLPTLNLYLARHPLLWDDAGHDFIYLRMNSGLLSSYYCQFLPVRIPYLSVAGRIPIMYILYRNIYIYIYVYIILYV